MRDSIELTLDAQGIDAAAERLMRSAAADEVSRKNVLRSRIFLEEAMARTLREQGEGAQVLFEEKRGFRFRYVTVKLRGPSFDPFSDESGEELESGIIVQKLMDMEGIAPA